MPHVRCTKQRQRRFGIGGGIEAYTLERLRAAAPCAPLRQGRRSNVVTVEHTEACCLCACKVGHLGRGDKALRHGLVQAGGGGQRWACAPALHRGGQFKGMAAQGIGRAAARQQRTDGTGGLRDGVAVGQRRRGKGAGALCAMTRIVQIAHGWAVAGCRNKAREIFKVQLCIYVLTLYTMCAILASTRLRTNTRHMHVLLHGILHASTHKSKWNCAAALKRTRLRARRRTR